MSTVREIERTETPFTDDHHENANRGLDLVGQQFVHTVSASRMVSPHLTVRRTSACVNGRSPLPVGMRCAVSANEFNVGRRNAWYTARDPMPLFFPENSLTHPPVTASTSRRRS